MLPSFVFSNAPSSSGGALTPLPVTRTKTPVVAPVASDATALTKPQNTRLDKKTVDEAVKTLNDYTHLVAKGVEFSVDDKSGRSIVKVVDTETQEVLRQFPSAEAISIARAIDKMQGLLINTKA